MKADCQNIKMKAPKNDLDQNCFCDTLLLVQCLVSGPVLWAGGDSPFQCSQWSGNTGSSWTQHSPWKIPRLCAASRSQQKGERRKEAFQTEPNQTGTTPNPHIHLQNLFSQIAKQRQIASKWITKQKTHVDGAG